MADVKKVYFVRHGESKWNVEDKICGLQSLLLQEAEAGKVDTKTVCPHCGKKTTAGMHYCGWCGELLSGTV